MESNGEIIISWVIDKKPQRAAILGVENLKSLLETIRKDHNTNSDTEYNIQIFYRNINTKIKQIKTYV